MIISVVPEPWSESFAHQENLFAMSQEREKLLVLSDLDPPQILPFVFLFFEVTMFNFRVMNLLFLANWTLDCDGLWNPSMCFQTSWYFESSRPCFVSLIEISFQKIFKLLRTFFCSKHFPTFLVKNVSSLNVLGCKTKTQQKFFTTSLHRTMAQECARCRELVFFKSSSLLIEKHFNQSVLVFFFNPISVVLR